MKYILREVSVRMDQGGALGVLDLPGEIIAVLRSAVTDDGCDLTVLHEHPESRQRRLPRPRPGGSPLEGVPVR
jgi:hypothetical protein